MAVPRTLRLAVPHCVPHCQNFCQCTAALYCQWQLCTLTGIRQQWHRRRPRSANSSLSHSVLPEPKVAGPTATATWHCVALAHWQWQWAALRLRCRPTLRLRGRCCYCQWQWQCHWQQCTRQHQWCPLPTLPTGGSSLLPLPPIAGTCPTGWHSGTPPPMRARCTAFCPHCQPPCCYPGREKREKA